MKTTIGLTERVIIVGKDKKKKEVMAKVDTGATKSSIDKKLVQDLQLGPALSTKLVKSAQGHTLRPVVKVKLTLKKKTRNIEVTVADRSHLRYKVLIGQNMLKEGFLIDPSK